MGRSRRFHEHVAAVLTEGREVSGRPDDPDPRRGVENPEVAVDEARTRVLLGRTGILSRLAHVHVAVWLTSLVGLSVAYRIVTAGAAVAPAIFPDELIYTDLARSLAETGHFAVGGAPFSAWSFGPLYPLLLAPVFTLTHDPATAYAVVKTVNAVVVSLAAIPAYLLGRHVLERRAALTFAAVTLFVPSLVYSSHVMTESLAYPVFLTVVLAAQRALERPSAGRQLTVVALLTVATLTRAQMVVLLPAYATAILAVARLRTRGAARSPNGLRSTFAMHRTSWLALAGISCAGLAAAAAASGAVLGSHTALASGIDLLAVPSRFASHLAELDLASGLIPFVAFLFLLLSVRRLGRPLAAFVVATGAIVCWMLLLTAVYASRPLPAPRIYERYVFYLTPLLVLCLFAWIAQGLPRPRRVRNWMVVGAASALPFATPLGKVLVDRVWGVSTSTVGLVPWGLVRLAADSLVPVYVGMSMLLTLLAVLVLRARPKTAGPLVAAIFVQFAVVGLIVHAANVAIAARASRLGVAPSDPAWIDRTVGERAQVAAIWTGTSRSGWHSAYGIWENAFYNRSLTTVYTIRGPFPGQWATKRLTVRGGVATLAGEPVRPRYVLADPTVAVRGTVVARDGPTGMTLYRIRGDLRLRLVRSAVRQQQPDA